MFACLEEGDRLYKAGAKSAACVFYEKACRAGDLGGCTESGVCITDGFGPAGATPADAANRFQRACDGYRDVACGLLGFERMKTDPAGSVALHQKGCDAELAGSCLVLARFYRAGKVLPPDENSAQSYYSRACLHEYFEACIELGVFQEDIWKRTRVGGGGLSFHKACEHGLRAGCRLDAIAELDHGNRTVAVQMLEVECRGGDPIACRLLAHALDIGQGGIARDSKRALALFEAQCQAGDALSCANAGSMQEDGRVSGSPDWAGASAFFDKTCALGNAWGCAKSGDLAVQAAPPRGAFASAQFKHGCDLDDRDSCASLAALHNGGKVVKSDPAVFLAAVKRGCDLGDAYSCYWYAASYRNGTGTPVNMATARELDEAACGRGFLDNCIGAGISNSTVNEPGAPKNAARGLGYLYQACEAGSGAACEILGTYYAAGIGGPVNLPYALAFARRGCVAGNRPACADAAERMIVDRAVGQEDEALATLKSLCASGVASGCRALGRIQCSLSSATSVAKDDVAALGFFNQACGLGDGESCVYVGVCSLRGLGTRVDTKSAIAVFKKACEGGNLLGCNSWGDAYEHGTGVKKDFVRALRLYHQACDGGLAAGCKGLGDLYRGVKGIPADWEASQGNYRHACEGGYAAACALVK